MVDPDRPLRYLEVRATATVAPDPDGTSRDRIAAKHGYDDGARFDPTGSSRVDLHLSPTSVIEH